MKEKLLRLARKVRAMFPSKLPMGTGEFDAWAESFHDTYTMPTEDRPSVKYALATMIMHGGPTTAYKSKFYYYLALSASASKQVAGQVFYNIKEEQKKKAEANVQAPSGT